MFEKIKDIIINNKNKKIEKLISFLIILVITLIVINSILKEDSKQEKIIDTQNHELVKIEEKQNDNNFEEKLEKVLSKIDGVGNVEVLITYSESKSINPLYNENSSSSTIQEDSKITETQSNSKEILVDSSSNPIIKNTSFPKTEGAIIIAEGAKIAEIKNNIISAVEAATGLASHKIQVFEMKKNINNY